MPNLKIKMSIKKVYLKSKPECKVTFTVSAGNVPEKSVVYLCGDFNQWEEKSLRLKKNKAGDYSVSLTLPLGKYQFKYNVDGQYWINDDAADAYPSNVFGSDNSLIEL